MLGAEPRARQRVYQALFELNAVLGVLEDEEPDAAHIHLLIKTINNLTRKLLG